jgi:hypothetical protein
MRTRKFGMNKTVDLTTLLKNKTMLYGITIIIFIIGSYTISLYLNSKIVFQYRVKDNYSGPCIIFLDENELNSNELIISSGLNIISQNVRKKTFIFKSHNTNKEIDIVPIGNKNHRDMNKRYIFNLSIGKQTSSCSDKIIQRICFFVGSETEFVYWKKNNLDEFNYFESKGIDWCLFYKSHTFPAP